jgi:hypothetical protein
MISVDGIVRQKSILIQTDAYTVFALKISPNDASTLADDLVSSSLVSIAFQTKTGVESLLYLHEGFKVGKTFSFKFLRRVKMAQGKDAVRALLYVESFSSVHRVIQDDEVKEEDVNVPMSPELLDSDEDGSEMDEDQEGDCTQIYSSQALFDELDDVKESIVEESKGPRHKFEISHQFISITARISDIVDAVEGRYQLENCIDLDISALYLRSRGLGLRVGMRVKFN